VNAGAPILIIGASAAGVSAARGLRDRGFEGGVVLIDADPHLPYERPPLSKQMIEAPAAAREDFPLLTAPQAEDLRLELRLGDRVKRIAPESLSITLADGETMKGSAILLATGGRARRLPIPGVDLAGVHVIRTLADARALREDLAAARTVAVVGGGLIGAEAAMSVLRAGKPVVWIDAAQAPLSHIFPSAIADHLVASHLAAGLELRAVARLRRLVGRGGRVVAIEMEDGCVAADVVILGVGMSPDDGLARAAGLDASCGVHVGQDHRTSAPGVFAAGDVAAFAIPGRGRRRHEHWRSAQAQGVNAARAMMGLPVEAPAVPWFWSDQGAHHVEMAGRRTGDSLVRRGGRGPIVWEMDGDRLAGVASIDEPNAVRVGLRLIQSGKALDRAALTDPRIDPRALLGA
jgi:3-phenylpropionate/trans-cinnamate dioxygenase ferredoxin reductase subunit